MLGLESPFCFFNVACTRHNGTWGPFLEDPTLWLNNVWIFNEMGPFKGMLGLCSLITVSKIICRSITWDFTTSSTATWKVAGVFKGWVGWCVVVNLWSVTVFLLKSIESSFYLWSQNMINAFWFPNLLSDIWVRDLHCIWKSWGPRFYFRHYFDWEWTIKALF